MRAPESDGQSISPLAELDTLEYLRVLVGGVPLLNDDLVLAAGGARLGLIDIEGTQLASLGDELRAGGAAVVERHLDAADHNSFLTFLERVEGQLGPVSGLVNCAGLWDPQPYDQLDQASWRVTIDANLQTAFTGCSAVLPGMFERRRGSIVNFASTAGESGASGRRRTTRLQRAA